MESSSLCDKYIDISPALRARTAVFPGDTPFSTNANMSFKAGHHLDLSEIKTTVHIGAHADAPGHYHPEGVTIEKRSLSLYMGHCQVVEVNVARGTRIFPSDLSTTITAPRVLFKTRSFLNPDAWSEDFNSLSPELIFFLHQLGVKLVGIDTPSVDPATAKELTAHLALYKTDMAVLEGLMLEDVACGHYQLIALPLKIEGAEASPVRAILLPKEHSWT